MRSRPNQNHLHTHTRAPTCDERAQYGHIHIRILCHNTRRQSNTSRVSVAPAVLQFRTSTRCRTLVLSEIHRATHAQGTPCATASMNPDDASALTGYVASVPAHTSHRARHRKLRKSDVPASKHTGNRPVTHTRERHTTHITHSNPHQ
jgi:hypothetical protein